MAPTNLDSWNAFQDDKKGKGWGREEKKQYYHEWKSQNQKERGSRAASAPRAPAPSPRPRSPSPWDEHRRACKGLGLSLPEISQLYWEKKDRPVSAPRGRGAVASAGGDASRAGSPATRSKPLKAASQPQPPPLPSTRTPPPRRSSPPARQRPTPVANKPSILDNVLLHGGWAQPQLTRDYARPHHHLALRSAASAAVGQRLVATTLPAGLYQHHVGSSGVPIRGGAKAAMFTTFGNPRVFTCAHRHCYTTVYAADGKGVGAHIMVSRDMELQKLRGMGGTAVVPMCNEHHNCRGAQVELKETVALLDRGTPVDLRIQVPVVVGPQSRPRSRARGRAV